MAQGDLGKKEMAFFSILGLFALYGLTAHEAGFWPFRSPAARQAVRAKKATGLPAPDATALVAVFRSSGLLIRDDGSRYWVSAPLWSRLDALAKERACVALYTWRFAQGRQLPVEILDAQGGHRLATYNSWSGFTAE